MQEAITHPLSLCAWLGIIADLWSYLLREIIKINEPCGTCWMPREIYCSGCAFLLLCCWSCQEFFYKCKWRHGLIVEEEKSSFNVIKYFGLFSPTSLNDTILFCIMMWEPNTHTLRIPVGSAGLTHPDTGSRYRRRWSLENLVPKSKQSLNGEGEEKSTVAIAVNAKRVSIICSTREVLLLLSRSALKLHDCPRWQYQCAFVLNV